MTSAVTTKTTDNGHGLASVEDLFPSGPRKRRYDEVPLPVADKTVRIRSLTEREMSAYQGATISQRGQGLIKGRLQDAARRLIVLCAVDAAGNQIMSDPHVKLMADWDSADVQALYSACTKHCGVSESDLEELAKNSSETPVES